MNSLFFKFPFYHFLKIPLPCEHVFSAKMRRDTVNNRELAGGWEGRKHYQPFINVSFIAGMVSVMRVIHIIISMVSLMSISFFQVNNNNNKKITWIVLIKVNAISDQGIISACCMRKTACKI